MRVLIADDDPTSREIARYIVAAVGHEVVAVADGAAALAALLGARFDAALLDLFMPEPCGPAVAQAVAAALPPGSRPLLIALTAAGPDTPPDPAFDAVLSKPLSPAALAAALRRRA